MARLSQEKKQELVKGSGINDNLILRAQQNMSSAISAFVVQATKEGQQGAISAGVISALKNTLDKDQIKWVKQGL